jgi:Lar family restriction alleviation protein
MTELKPCPFCGSRKTRLQGCSYAYWVTCEECEASIGVYITEEKAIEAWNKRAEPKVERNLDVNGFSDYAEFE